MNPAQDNDLPNEIDFSQGARGQFYHPGSKLNLPIYLDETIQARLASLANAKRVELSELVNALLRKDIDLIEIAT